MNAIFAISKAVLFLSIALSIAYTIINAIFAIGKGVLQLIASIAQQLYAIPSMQFCYFMIIHFLIYYSQNTILLMFTIIFLVFLLLF